MCGGRSPRHRILTRGSSGFPDSAHQLSASPGLRCCRCVSLSVRTIAQRTQNGARGRPAGLQADRVGRPHCAQRTRALRSRRISHRWSRRCCRHRTRDRQRTIPKWESSCFPTPRRCNRDAKYTSNSAEFFSRVNGLLPQLVLLLRHIRKAGRTSVVYIPSSSGMLCVPPPVTFPVLTRLALTNGRCRELVIFRGRGNQWAGSGPRKGTLGHRLGRQDHRSPTAQLVNHCGRFCVWCVVRSVDRAAGA